MGTDDRVRVGVCSGQMTRRTMFGRGAGFMVGLTAVTWPNLIGGSTSLAEAASSTTQQTNANRAVAAYNAMQKYFYVKDAKSLYRETYPFTGGNKYSFLWPFSRALIGTLALAGVPPVLVGGTSYASAVTNRVTGLTNYWDGKANPPAYDSYVLSQGGGDKYFDDNTWVSLALIEQYQMGLTTSLTRAEQLFTFAKSGWDTSTTDTDAGGMFWVQQGSGAGLSNHDRATGSNGGSAELGLHLHLLTGSSTYDGDGSTTSKPASLGATNMMNWVNAHLDSSGSGTGLFWNSLNDSGIDKNIWSYTQGVMIGANVMRYRLTNSATYLNNAVGIANKALSYFGNFEGQPPSFNAMLFQNLLELYPYAGSSVQTSILQAMQSYGDWAWNNTAARDPSTNLFYFNDAGQPVRGAGAAQLRDQGAMTQLYALLGWNSTDYSKLT